MIKKVPFLFWGCIPLILVYGLINRDEALDINIHDTYFVFALYFVLIRLCLYFYLMGLGYYLSYYSDKFKPLNILTLVHVVLTIISLLLLFFIPQFSEVNPNDLTENVKKSQLYGVCRELGVLGFVVAQVIFLVNLTISLFRR